MTRIREGAGESLALAKTKLEDNYKRLYQKALSVDARWAAVSQLKIRGLSAVDNVKMRAKHEVDNWLVIPPFPLVSVIFWRSSVYVVDIGGLHVRLREISFSQR